MRRLYHLIAGILLVLIVAYIDKGEALLLISSLLIIAIVTEAARLHISGLNRLFFRYLGPLLRQEEKGRPTGSGYYLAGVLISLLLFEREIALFSMTILAVGDPAASAAGQRWGTYRIRGKSIEGATAFLIASIAAGLVFQRLLAGLPLMVIITGSIAGALTELLSNRANDNLLIPLVTSGTMEIVSFYINRL